MPTHHPALPTPPPPRAAQNATSSLALLNTTRALRQASLAANASREAAAQQLASATAQRNAAQQALQAKQVWAPAGEGADKGEERGWW